ncbi:MAG: hypothetical protein KDB14_28800 [Planctomycetales bacterium]|nr:hypothetical protein [Planctomycetales bacterium]
MRNYWLCLAVAMGIASLEGNAPAQGQERLAAESRSTARTGALQSDTGRQAGAQSTAVLVDGVLTILGSQHHDRIVIARDLINLNTLNVFMGTGGPSGPVLLQWSAVQFDINMVSHILVMTYEGNDHVFNLTNTTSTIYGGDGNDKLIGGSSSDAIYGEGGGDIIFGGLGVDALYGGDRSDVLVGGPPGELFYDATNGDFSMGANGESWGVTLQKWLDTGDDIDEQNDYLNGGADADLYVTESVLYEQQNAPFGVWLQYETLAGFTPGLDWTID